MESLPPSCLCFAPSSLVKIHAHNRRSASALLRSSHRLSSRRRPIQSCSAGKPARRDVLKSIAVVTALSLAPVSSSAMNGLRVFPLRSPLTNTYYLMRASESITDAKKRLSSNPVEKISLEKHSLTRKGVETSIAAGDALIGKGVDDDIWIWSSDTISCYETAEVLASHLQVRRDRIVPEFALLDARGLGVFDGRTVSEVCSLFASHDAEDAAWKPQAANDGTPNDSVYDIYARITQLLSKLETQYFGEKVLVIGPDSDTLSIWQSAVMGTDLRQHSRFAFIPGEIRRVRELVVDSYGEVTQKPEWEDVFIPV